MSAAEESIVYFFAGAVEYGNVCVQILSCTVCLYGFYAAVKNTVDGRQEIGVVMLSASMMTTMSNAFVSMESMAIASALAFELSL